MSNYTKVTNFTAKDSLPSGNTGKVVRGSEIDTEFTNIQTAVNSKADTASPTFTGTVTIPTAAITGGSITGITDLAIADGGTGASTAQNARNNLLPSQSTHAGKYLKTDGTDVSWDALDISTADITGTLPIANGGTGATSASAARTALGVAIGTDVQAYDAQLADIAGLTPTDGNFIVGDGTNFVAESGATARTSLGLGSIATQAANNVSITGGSISGITDLAVADGGTGASDASGARTNLGLGSIATQDASNVSITGGSISGITDLAIADGGTGASTANTALNNLLPSQSTNAGKYLVTDGTNTSWDQINISTSDITGTLPIANGGTGSTTASGARTALGLAIGTDVQAYDAELAAIAGLTSAADKVPYFTGAGTAAVADFTSFGRSLVDDADASAARSTLGLVIGTNVQAYDAELAAIAGLTSAADKLPYFTGAGTASTTDFTSFGRSLVDDADASAARTTLGLVIGTNVQAYDAQLADVAGLTPTDNGVIIGNGTNFVVESGATLKTSLGLTIGTDVQAYDSNLTSFVNAFTLPTTDGTNGQALTTNGSGTISWSTVAGAPGGSNTQLQYNNNGAFGGASGLVTDGTNLTLNGQADLRFADSDSSNWVAFQAPATISSNVTWTLPSADGTSGQVLSTDGSGTLSWATAASGGGSGGGTAVTVTQITATASQTTFNVTYTVGQISVYLNGALLASADYTATNGTTVVLATGAAANDIFTAVVYSTVTGLTLQSTSPFGSFVGSGAGAVTTGVNNTFVGYEAGNDNTTGTNNTAVGYQALDVNTGGIYNTAVGTGAMGANTTGQENTALGGLALLTNTTGNYNVAVGVEALRFNTIASYNTGVGYQALTANTTGAYNVAVGYRALDANTTGQQNVAVGTSALGANTTANFNVAIGERTLLSNTTGEGNTALGTYAMYTNTTGVESVGLGYYALYNSTTGARNTAAGTYALYANTTGESNVAIGHTSLDNNTSGSFNVAMGRLSLQSNTTGGYNVAVGYQANYSSTTASYNVGIGPFANFGITTGENNIGVGYATLYANTTGSNNTAIGHAALSSNTTGLRNSAVGYQSLSSNTTGYDNVAVGYNTLLGTTTGLYNTGLGNYAGDGVTTGSYNVIIGTESATSAGSTLTTGSYNTIIGCYAGTSAAGGNKQIVIGYNVAGQADANVTIGSSSGKIYNAYESNATWTQTSDGTMKNVIGPDTLGLSFINRLNPIKFTWKPQNELPEDHPYYNEVNSKDTTTVIHGFVAQDVKAAMDAEGCLTFNGWDEGPDGIQAISREMFISPLVKAIQELSAKCDALQAELNQLKGN